MGLSEYQQGFEQGYDSGKTDMITDIYNFVDLQEDSSVKREILDYITTHYEEFIKRFGLDKPTAYENKFCYDKTFEYRGFKIDIFDDDYGQQCYFYFNNRSYPCGSYNYYPEEYIKYVVDEFLDLDFDFRVVDVKYFGAYLKYSNHKHTKMTLTFRGEVLKEFTDLSVGTLAIRQECINILEKLFASKEFQEAEQKRLEEGNLYFSDIISENQEDGDK